jgi:hypothetical protein
MRRIQTFDVPFYTMKAQLDGAQYNFAFKWNHRTSTWSFNLDQADGTPIVHGLRIMVGVPLLVRYHYNDACPPGEIICNSNTADDSPPGLHDLANGGRCKLVYAPLLDLIALAQGSTVPSDLG